MKRWAGWLLILGAATLATIAISLSLRPRPSELERRLATIRPGMTREEVAEIMNMGEPKPECRKGDVASPRSGTWHFHPSSGREVELTVMFDDDGRVTESAVRKAP
jgi:hypothetical protein